MSFASSSRIHVRRQLLVVIRFVDLDVVVVVAVCVRFS